MEHKVNPNDLIDEASLLPVEERVLIVDSLLRSFNQLNTEIDNEWLSMAKTRLAQMKDSSVSAVPRRDVFEKIRKRFET